MDRLILTDVLRSPSNGQSIRSRLARCNALLLGLTFLLAATLLGAALPLQTGASSVQLSPSLTNVQSNADRYTAPYVWTVFGTVRDNAGAPVQGATITTSPDAISPAMSDADGVYAAYVAADATTYTASVAKAGYGILPTTTFIKTEDAQVDLVLPPADNVVRNWGFESGSLQPDWQTSGLTPAVITSTLRHTGAQAAWLGEPHAAFTTPVNLSNSDFNEGGLQMAPDGAGGLHLLWHESHPEGSETAIYARRAGDGTWIVPPGPIPAPESGAWASFRAWS